MQQGYFEQCNDIISNLEETLSALQLTVSDLHAWAFGSDPAKEGDGEEKLVGVKHVPSRVMQNRLIDALEHATAILSDANEVQIFMMGGEYEGAPDDWVDDLQQSAQASPVKQAKPETLEAVDVARKIAGDRKTVMIGKNEVPAPINAPLKKGEKYYMADTKSAHLYSAGVWEDFYVDSERLRMGRLHATIDAAIAHAKALIAVSKGE